MPEYTLVISSRRMCIDSLTRVTLLTVTACSIELGGMWSSPLFQANMILGMLAATANIIFLGEILVSGLSQLGVADAVLSKL
jgi:hypothetical protein